MHQAGVGRTRPGPTHDGRVCTAPLSGHTGVASGGVAGSELCPCSVPQAGRGRDWPRCQLGTPTLPKRRGHPQAHVSGHLGSGSGNRAEEGHLESWA